VGTILITMSWASGQQWQCSDTHQ